MSEPDFNPNLVHIGAITGFATPHEPGSLEAGDFGLLLSDIYDWTDVRLDALYPSGTAAFHDSPGVGECHELIVLRGAAQLAIDGVAVPLGAADAKVIRIGAGRQYAVAGLPGQTALLVRYRHARREECLTWQPGRLRHLAAWRGLAHVADVARRHADDRGRRLGDVFSTQRGDINITWAYPGVITAWHAHTAQDDNWFVLAGALKAGLAKPSDSGFESRFIHLSAFERLSLRIPSGVLHGWRNFTAEEAILMYYITNKYDPANPDELRFSLDEVGADWSTLVR